LDASGGGVFLNLRGAAEGALIRAAASTQTFGDQVSGRKQNEAMGKPVNVFLLLLTAFLIQFPLTFIAIGLGTMGRAFDLNIGNTLGLFLSPGIAYFWAEGFHSSYPLAGLLAGVIVNTLYFALILFVGSIVRTKLRT
jgi:hypothetical protein